MARAFRYEAVDATGKRVSDVMEATSEDEVRAALYKEGKMVTTIKPLEKGVVMKDWRRFFERRLKTAELVLFTQQLKTLYTAGIALPEIFSILHDQVKNKEFRQVVGDMHRRILEGESLEQAFGAHKKVFSSLYCAMIVAGQQSGALPEVLTRLVAILQHEEKVKQKIESATRYPKMVVAAMVLAFLVLLNFVIPQFEDVYASAKVDLPIPTKIAIELNHLFKAYWWMILIAVSVCVVAWNRYKKTERGRLWRDTISLKLPIIGTVVQKAAIARFASIFGILQRSGISVLNSMDIVRDTIDNAFFQSRFHAIKEHLKSGGGIGDAMKNSKGFTPLAVSLVTVGENAGNLEEMLDQLASHYDNEVSLAVEEMTEWIGPILIICLGVVVLFFALAIFLPMWDMVKFVQ